MKWEHFTVKQTDRQTDKEIFHSFELFYLIEWQKHWRASCMQLLSDFGDHFVSVWWI